MVMFMDATSRNGAKPIRFTTSLSYGDSKFEASTSFSSKSVFSLIVGNSYTEFFIFRHSLSSFVMTEAVDATDRASAF